MYFSENKILIFHVNRHMKCQGLISLKKIIKKSLSSAAVMTGTRIRLTALKNVDQENIDSVIRDV